MLVHAANDRGISRYTQWVDIIHITIKTCTYSKTYNYDFLIIIATLVCLLNCYSYNST